MAARLFTLMHELAHLWVGSSGISNASPGNTRREEVFCNAVAGEFLVPQNVFIPLWTASTASRPERLAEALSGRLLLRDAGRLLGVQPGKLRLLAGELEQ